MPFTANRQFKKTPRLLARAEGMYYWTPDDRQILDGTSGLWCVNAGHCRPKIVAGGAAPGRARWTSRRPSTWATRSRSSSPSAWREIAPPGFSRVFFTNSGSESADTALKIALAYHRARGEAGRYRLIGRERGYHGVNFGGMAVGGITTNKKMFGPGVAGVDHIRHTHDPARNAFSKGQPKHGVGVRRRAGAALRAARPVDHRRGDRRAGRRLGRRAGAAGRVPGAPARDLHAHGILLIFDEVITGFGRLGKPFGAQRFGVMPDLFTTAKGLTNAHGADGRGLRAGCDLSRRS